MKKYFYLCLLMLCILNPGCKDNEEESQIISSFKVINANTSLPAIGGMGVIELSAIGDYTVTSSEDWCIPTVSGNKIQLNISTNEDIEGRNALVKINKGEENLSIPVSQLGAIFSTNMPAYYNFPASGERKAYYFKTNLPYEITYDAKWLSHKIEGDSIIFTSISYPEGTIVEKAIAINIKSGKLKESYTFCQMAYKDLTGKYDLSYVDKTGKAVNQVAQLVKYQPDKYVMLDGPMSGAQFVVDYNNGNLIIAAGQYLGTVPPYFVYSCVIADNDNITWETKCQYMAIPKVIDNKLTFVFKDNETFPGNKVIGLYFAAFTSKTASSDTYYGGLDRALNMVMTKQ